MEPSFCNETRRVLLQAAEKLSIKCRDGGTAVVVEGPRFSTLAESQLFRSWGAHLVNMTLAPEVSVTIYDSLGISIKSRQSNSSSILGSTSQGSRASVRLYRHGH